MFVEPWLIQKYATTGPRYTSYPTAPAFQTRFNGETLQNALKQTPPKKLSLYIHIPFCHKLCWYCGCNMKVSRNPEEIKHYIETLKREIIRAAKFQNRDVQVYQLHFGGGTPTYLEPQQLADLVQVIRSHWNLVPEAEISIEGDPRQLGDAILETMTQIGFNRVSLGIQDVDPDVQNAINRVQSPELISQKLADLRNRGFQNINFDLIYGLPKQTPQTFSNTVHTIIQMQPSRISLFNFAYLPSKKVHMKLIKPEDLPCPKAKVTMFLDTISALRAAGYVFIGMDHFSRPDDDLATAEKSGELHRNFQGYTTMPDLQMLGFGASAISMLDSLYVQNPIALGAYHEAMERETLPAVRGIILTQDDKWRRTIISDLMCSFNVDIPTIEALVESSFDSYFPDVRRKLESFVNDHLMSAEGERYIVTEKGRLFLRNIAMCFDAYLDHMVATQGVKFSQTL